VPRRIEIPEAELRHLYLEERLSQRQIATLLDCSKSTIGRKMQKCGTPARSKEEAAAFLPWSVDIPETELRRLYLEEELTQSEIGRIFGCSGTSVRRKMQEYNIPSRSNAEAQMMHPRRSFSGDPLEKAYLIGFAKGDLSVSKPNESGETIKVTCGSSRWEQIELFETLFSAYGSVWISRQYKWGSRDCRVLLDLSFSFLLELKDDIPAWILANGNGEAFLAFLAGYTDAEGNIGIYDGRARFQLASCDKDILHQIHTKLQEMGFKLPRPKIAMPAGYVHKDGYRLKRDYWYLRASRKSTLLGLLKRLQPYFKHAKRVQDMEAAIHNIEERNACHKRQGQKSKWH